MIISKITLNSSVLMIWLFVSGCSTGNSSSSVEIPKETKTVVPVSTPTNTPLPTPDPSIAVLAEARQKIEMGDSEAAVILLNKILQESLDPSIRMDAINDLASIGTEMKFWLDETWKNYLSPEELVKFCGFYQEVYDVFKPVLDAEDRPDFKQNEFYIAAAETEVILTECARSYLDPGISYTEAITILFDTMKAYPDEPEVQQVFAYEVVKIFNLQMKTEYEKDPVGIKSLADRITSEIGDFPYYEGKISDRIFAGLMEQSICSENSDKSEVFGLVEPKKIYSCDSSLIKLAATNLLGKEPGEIWYVLEYEHTENSDLSCKGFYSTGNFYFTYSYPGQWKDIYILKDIKTGKVISKKTFTSTAPKCVMSSCDLNTTLRTATCQGGEGRSTFDEFVFVQWLTDSIK